MADKITTARSFCSRHGISNETIREDGTIDVDGDVDLSNSEIEVFPVQFGVVSGNFNCADMKLTSLVGSPHTVGGNYNCSYSNITSLKGAPQSVGGADNIKDVNSGFNCCHTKIISLKDAPKSVSGNFSCHHTNITSLQYAPQSVGGSFFCGGLDITSLKGAPQSVGGGFSCGGSKIDSLEDAPQTVGGDFRCRNTQITSLTGIEKIIKKLNGGFYCDSDVTHMLGLLLIPGVKRVETGNTRINNIFNKYVGTGDILSAQDELIDAGFKDEARL